jgi:outer membrane immunogenic protein
MAIVIQERGFDTCRIIRSLRTHKEGIAVKKTSIARAALLLALSAGSAIAADLPSRKGPAPAFVPPPPMWTGFYVGLNAGGTWSESNNITVGSVPTLFTPVQNTAPFFAANYASLTSGVIPVSSSGGFIGGGQIGYNWQFSNAFVAGIEADIQGVTSGSSSSSSAGAMVDQFGNAISNVSSFSKRLDYLGTVRGRIGFLVTPTLLAYGTGGLAYGGISTSAAFAQTITNPFVGPSYGSGSFSDTRVGWTAGGGLEWLFMPNWSAKVEYLYYDLGTAESFATIAPPLAPGNGGGVMFANLLQAQTRFNGHIVRAGVNYHFNFGQAPTVAGY